MGKVRRARQKYHLARAKSMNDISTLAEGAEADERKSAAPPAALSVSSNLFEGVDMAAAWGRPSRDEDVRSIVTTKSSFKESGLSKMQRRTARHDAFMKKLDVIQTMKKEARDRKNRQKTAITGDMRPLADALPPLEYAVGPAATRAGKTPPARQRALPKARQRQKEMLDDISVFRRVLADPVYKTDPAGAISNYIQEKIQLELMDEI